MTDPVAFRKLICVDPSGDAVTVTVAVGKPHDRDGVTKCPVSVAPLYGWLPDIPGVDSWQALQLALALVDLLLKAEVEKGKRLYWEHGGEMLPDRYIWVFNGGSSGLPGGVFTRREIAEAWIAKHHLSGVLTAYPVDEGCFDFAARNGLLSRRTVEECEAGRINVGSFSSARLDHVHYEDGRCVSE